MNAVEFAYNSNLLKGTSATKFSPGASMTRGMFVQVLANKTSNYYEDYYKQRYSYYDDVNINSWMSPSIRWASDIRIVSGTSTTSFFPVRALNREEMAVMLYNYVEKTENDKSYNSNKAKAFSDYSLVSSWAKTAIEWAVDKNIISGSNGKINPKGKATRAQVAQIFKNADYLLVKDYVKAEDNPPTKANIAMLFSRSNHLNMGILAMEYNFNNPLYIDSLSYPCYNVIGMNSVEDISKYLLSFLTLDAALECIEDATLFELDGSIYSMIPPHGYTTDYNSDSIKIESVNENVYLVSIDYFFFAPTTYGGTSVMEIILENGDYKISKPYCYTYQKNTPSLYSDSKVLPYYLLYKVW